MNYSLDDGNRRNADDRSLSDSSATHPVWVVAGSNADQMSAEDVRSDNLEAAYITNDSSVRDAIGDSSGLYQTLQEDSIGSSVPSYQEAFPLARSNLPSSLPHTTESSSYPPVNIFRAPMPDTTGLQSTPSKTIASSSLVRELAPQTMTEATTIYAPSHNTQPTNHLPVITSVSHPVASYSSTIQNHPMQHISRIPASHNIGSPAPVAYASPYLSKATTPLQTPAAPFRSSPAPLQQQPLRSVSPNVVPMSTSVLPATTSPQFRSVSPVQHRLASPVQQRSTSPYPMTSSPYPPTSQPMRANPSAVSPLAPAYGSPLQGVLHHPQTISGAALPSPAAMPLTSSRPEQPVINPYRVNPLASGAPVLNPNVMDLKFTDEPLIRVPQPGTQAGPHAGPHAVRDFTYDSLEDQKNPIPVGPPMRGFSVSTGGSRFSEVSSTPWDVKSRYLFACRGAGQAPDHIQGHAIHDQPEGASPFSLFFYDESAPNDVLMRNDVPDGTLKLARANMCMGLRENDRRRVYDDTTASSFMQQADDTYSEAPTDEQPFSGRDSNILPSLPLSDANLDARSRGLSGNRPSVVPLSARRSLQPMSRHSSVHRSRSLQQSKRSVIEYDEGTLKSVQTQTIGGSYKLRSLAPRSERPQKRNPMCCGGSAVDDQLSTWTDEDDYLSGIAGSRVPSHNVTTAESIALKPRKITSGSRAPSRSRSKYMVSQQQPYVSVNMYSAQPLGQDRARSPPLQSLSSFGQRPAGGCCGPANNTHSRNSSYQMSERAASAGFGSVYDPNYGSELESRRPSRDISRKLSVPRSQIRSRSHRTGPPTSNRLSAPRDAPIAGLRSAPQKQTPWCCDRPENGSVGFNSTLGDSVRGLSTGPYSTGPEQYSTRYSAAPMSHTGSQAGQAQPGSAAPMSYNGSQVQPRGVGSTGSYGYAPQSYRSGRNSRADSPRHSGYQMSTGSYMLDSAGQEESLLSTPEKKEADKDTGYVLRKMYFDAEDPDSVPERGTDFKMLPSHSTSYRNFPHVCYDVVTPVKYDEFFRSRHPPKFFK